MPTIGGPVNTSVAAAILTLVLSVCFGALLPWWVMRRLVPGLGGGPLAVANYRGRPVSATLGVVWPVWAAGLLLAQTLVDFLAGALAGDTFVGAAFSRLAMTPLAVPFFAAPFLLVAGTFAFGVFDDAFGAGGPKGFRGHLRALRHGRLTTGMLKLLGIGVLALVYGGGAAQGVVERSGIAGADASSGWRLLAWALAAATIALAANLANLLDLRPGRALKVYSVAVIAPAVAFVLGAVEAYETDIGAFAGLDPGALMSGAETAAATVALLIVVLGPVLAVWRFDLREEAMLGDGGANVAGAVVGYLLTGALSFVGLGVTVVVLFALNLLSERVSFSAVIERVPLLAALDRLGRDVPKAHDHTR